MIPEADPIFSPNRAKNNQRPATVLPATTCSIGVFFDPCVGTAPEQQLQGLWVTGQPSGRKLLWIQMVNQGDMKGALAGGMKSVGEIDRPMHAGMTNEEFEKSVKGWIATANAASAAWIERSTRRQRNAFPGSEIPGKQKGFNS